MNTIRSDKHQLYIEEINKKALGAFDDKIYCCEFAPRRRANGRVSPIAAASPTERAIQSWPSGYVLCKWENLQNRQCIKYLFSPLYIKKKLFIAFAVSGILAFNNCAIVPSCPPAASLFFNFWIASLIPSSIKYDVRISLDDASLNWSAGGFTRSFRFRISCPSLELFFF